MPVADLDIAPWPRTSGLQRVAGNDGWTKKQRRELQTRDAFVLGRRTVRAGCASRVSGEHAESTMERLHAIGHHILPRLCMCLNVKRFLLYMS
jgi:hypothetical protein